MVVVSRFVFYTKAANFVITSVISIHRTDYRHIEHLSCRGKLGSNGGKIQTETTAETRDVVGDYIMNGTHHKGVSFIPRFRAKLLPEYSLRLSVFLGRFSSLDGGIKLLLLSLGVRIWQALFPGPGHGLLKI